MSSYRILSLDGGGIRGLITAILLERLEQANPGFLAQVDLIAGTSTGGLLALGLAAGRSPTAARELYERKGETVFADSLVDDVFDLGGLIGAHYSIDPLKNALIEEFGEITLGELTKKVLISTFDLDNNPTKSDDLRTWKPKFFHNFPSKDSDEDQRVVDVALRTANAPTYFPIYQGYIDGGVVANNPSVCALAQALHPPSGGQKLDSIALLSMGTGHNPRFLDVQYGDWGLLHWAPHLVNIATEGSAGLVDYQCEQFLGKKYLRLNPVLPFPISMDKVNEIPLMIEIADNMDLSGTIHWLKRHYLS